MPAVRTHLTEIGTALGTLVPVLPIDLGDRPPELLGVSNEVWDSIREAQRDSVQRQLLLDAHSHGRAFLAAKSGLRNRRPLLVEWKGPDRPPGGDVVPADLRIDHVFLISCKYMSNIVLNTSPSRLFERLLMDDTRASVDWYSACAPNEYQRFYETVRDGTGLSILPECVGELSDSDRAVIRDALPRRLDSRMLAAQCALADAVALVSAQRWQAALSTAKRTEAMLWRLLRIGNASYYVLGASRSHRLRIRVASPWDWRQRYDLIDLAITPSKGSSQPTVKWRAEVKDRATGVIEWVLGHVEVRWSHGRFGRTQEAKVYLDSPHSQIPGYFPLD